MPQQKTSGRQGFWANMFALVGLMRPRRRLQLAITLGLTFVGAVAELVTIGAVLPMLAVVADTEQAVTVPLVEDALRLFGRSPGENLIIPAALFLISAAFMSAAVRLLLTWITQKFVYGVQQDITLRVYGNLIRQPYERFIGQNSSAAISGIEKVYQITIGIVSPVILGITSAGMAICIIGFLFFIDPAAATFASLSMGLLYLVITVANRRFLLKASVRAAAIRTERVKLLQESLGGIRDIILDQSHDVFDSKMAAIERENRRLQARAVFISMTPRFVVEAAGIVLVALLSIYFSTQPGGVLAAIPVLGALALGAQRLLPLLQNAYLSWASYSIHTQNLRDVLELAHMPQRPALGRRFDEPVTPFSRSIELRDVTFSYDGQARALVDLNMTINKGERIGLIGKTGSGKTTLVDLLMGLLRPTEGEMLVDDVAVNDVTIGAWQAQIAHVPQSIFLSDDSIAANIAFGSDGDLDLERVWQAAERADIKEFIEQLPEGMNTRVGERGVRLSGGQRQRIGISRALYKKATVLVLDEATSALDEKTEASVMASVAGLGRDLTIILIAHRLSTIAGCDTIYRLENGRIIQKGNYAQVVLASESAAASVSSGEESSRMGSPE
jgi:ATP-binding cassette, subfamily B, bacterial PglK